jgi:hypothetical protein
MNIFGRVFGGLLVLISLGWLATIVGIRPGWFGNNQINSSQGTTTNSLTTQSNPPVGANAGTNVNGAKTQTSTFNGTGAAAQTGKPATAGTTGQPEVEKDPRSATPPQPTKAVNQTAPATSAPAATAPAAPVSAGW